jgi:hypothetical protein
VQVERRFSAALDMERDLTLYLPPGHAVSGNYPVIYAADGEAVAGLAQVIEPLITAGSIPPLLIVGVHSGESDVRAMEYLPHINPQRFMAHARFFSACIEPAHAEARRRGDRERSGSGRLARHGRPDQGSMYLRTAIIRYVPLAIGLILSVYSSSHRG